MNAINTRKEKGRTETIYLRRVKNISELNREYDILGSSGKTYTLWINEKPTCTCPDFHGRTLRCKHIYYVLDKILNVDDRLIDNEEYSMDELCYIFGIKKELNEPNESSYIDNIYDNITNFIGCFK